MNNGSEHEELTWEIKPVLCQSEDQVMVNNFHMRLSRPFTWLVRFIAESSNKGIIIPKKKKAGRRRKKKALFSWKLDFVSREIRKKIFALFFFRVTVPNFPLKLPGFSFYWIYATSMFTSFTTFDVSLKPKKKGIFFFSPLEIRSGIMYSNFAN